MKHFLLLLVPLLIVICCSDITIHENYDLSKPAEIMELPHELLEVSGISFMKNEKIACVMDEDAVIFFFDKLNKQVTGTYRFGQRGDYEDLVVAGNMIYVLQSDGNLFQVDMNDSSGTKKEYTTGLAGKFETEGLCYDETNKRLLIACKSGTGKKSGGERMIFAFDPAAGKLEENPVISFKKSEIDEFLRNHQKELPKAITSLHGEEKMDNLLSPSGIAIHPITNQLYVLSARSNLLLISDMNGKILNMVNLPKDLFTQPEGITFTPDATLYISNEGKKNPATIIGFNYIN